MRRIHLSFALAAIALAACQAEDLPSGPTPEGGGQTALTLPR